MDFRAKQRKTERFCGKDPAKILLAIMQSAFSLLLPVPAARAEDSSDALMRDAKSYFDEGEFESSQECLKQALSKENNGSAGYALCLQNLALLEYLDFHFGESAKLYLKAIAACESLYGNDSLAVANNLYGLSRCLRRSNQFDEAENCLNRLLILRSKLFGADHKLVGNTLMDIAVNFDREEKNAQAEQYYQQVLDLREKQYGKTSPMLSPWLGQYAKFLRKIRNDEKASQIEARMLELSRSTEPIPTVLKDEDGSGWQSK